MSSANATIWTRSIADQPRAWSHVHGHRYVWLVGAQGRGLVRWHAYGEVQVHADTAGEWKSE